MSGMSQLALNLEKKLIYSADKFLLHSGVFPVLQELKVFATIKKYAASFVYGESRVGKTHFAVYLQELFSKDGKKVIIVDATDFKQFASFHLTKAYLNADLIILDDIDLYFFENEDDGSGLFVNFVEQQRKKGSKIIMLSGTNVSALPVDSHVLSRVNEASNLELKHPESGELSELLSMIAMQRGYKLSEKHKAYILKRMERSTQAFEYLLLRLDELILKEGKRVGISVLKRASE